MVPVHNTLSNGNPNVKVFQYHGIFQRSMHGLLLSVCATNLLFVHCDNFPPAQLLSSCQESLKAKRSQHSVHMHSCRDLAHVLGRPFSISQHNTVQDFESFQPRFATCILQFSQHQFLDSAVMYELFVASALQPVCFCKLLQ